MEKKEDNPFKQLLEMIKEAGDNGYIKQEGNSIFIDSGLQKMKIGSIKEQKLQKVIQQFFDKKDLAKKILDIQPIYYDSSKIWWLWESDNFRWKIVDEIDILNFVNKLSSANTFISKERNEILEALKQESRLRKPKDVSKNWIQFKNKFVDIITGEEFNVSSKYFSTNPIPYKLHQEKFFLTPKMDEIFEEWVGKDYVKTLYQIIAYCLLPSYPLHRIFCFIGEGMNGKSCFLNLLRKFIGGDNICSTELDVLLSSRFEVTRLHKKLVCQMGETNFGEMSKTSMLKKLSGGDLIGFEYKNKDPFEDINYAKILIATNNLPTTTDKTVGFYRRWLIIDFPNRFSEKKDILLDIPEEEFECLTIKCLAILKDLMNNKEFHNEGDIEDRIKKYEEKSDFFKAFINEFVQLGGEGYITKKDFYVKFTSWCKENRHRVLGENTIGKKMKEFGIESVRKKIDFYYERIQIWEGICWK